MFDNKVWKMMRITYVVSSDDHNSEENQVSDFLSLSVSNEKNDDDEHLHANEYILTIETEWVALVDTVSSCQYISA